MEMSGNKNKQKTSNKYCCINCNYYTDRKSNIDCHLTTARHMKEIIGNEIKQKTRLQNFIDNSNFLTAIVEFFKLFT